MQRLDRILSEAGVASRKALRAIIRAGRVTADGAVVTDESRKFDEAAVHIAVDGRPVACGAVLIMLHKPAGYRGRRSKAGTTMNRLDERERKLVKRASPAERTGAIIGRAETERCDRQSRKFDETVVASRWTESRAPARPVLIMLHKPAAI